MQWAQVLVALALLGSAAARSFNYSRFAGPYYGYLLRVRPCEGVAGSVGEFRADFTPFNRSDPLAGQRFSGSLTLLEDLDDSCWVNRTQSLRRLDSLTLLGSSLTTRGRPPGHPGVCSNLRADRDNWRTMFHMDPDAPGPCRIKAGTYAFRDRPSPRHLLTDPRPRPYGDYVFTETYGKAGRVLYCSRHELRLVPRT